jgi:hypothetical protein
MKYLGRRGVLAITVYHAWKSSTLKPNFGKRWYSVTCQRCGASRIPDIGEKLPVECHPTPQWLRDHPDDPRDT